MNEKEILLNKIDDKYNQCQNSNYMAYTNFLSMEEQGMALAHIKKEGYTNWVLHGGDTEAERNVLVFLPDYMSPEDFDSPLVVARVQKGKKDSLTHRDYLGSLMGLGLKREKVGDIFCNEYGADIVIFSDISEFVYSQLKQIGRAKVDVKIVDLKALLKAEQCFESKATTIASLRLDVVVAAILNTSRSKALEYIKAGRVFVNQLQKDKSDFNISEGDKITVRGVGKFIFSRIKNETKKGRLAVEFQIYK